MKKKTKAPRLQVGDKVVVVHSMHSHVLQQMEGTVEQILPKGYGVLFMNTVHQKNFGGAKYNKPAIVYMRQGDIVLVTEIPK